MTDVVTEALARKKDEPYRVAVMGTIPVLRQSQSWVNAELARLCGIFYERTLPLSGLELNLIPCVSGMAAAMWAGPLKVPYHLFLPWVDAEIPVALKPSEPFIAEPDARFVAAGATSVTETTNSRGYSGEAMAVCRRRLVDGVDAVIATHDSREVGKGQALTIRAYTGGKVVMLVDWRTKKSQVINKEKMPDAVEDPF